MLWTDNEDADLMISVLRRARVRSLLIGMLLGLSTCASIVSVVYGARMHDSLTLGLGIGLCALMLLVDLVTVLLHSEPGD